MFAAGRAPKVASDPVYVEDVFSTYLYTGTGATQTITNNINLSTKGGLVWGKNRTNDADHWLYDTSRGTEKPLTSNNANAQANNGGSTFGVTAFNSNGFTIGAGDSGARWNTAENNYCTWIFREQAKFFDIVTYTGNGAAGRQISHNLGSTPGCIIVKTTTGGNGWNVWHRDVGDSNELLLNSSNSSTNYGYFGGAPTSTTFTVNGSVGNGTNTNGETFVAYLFAHDAGGFGLTGTDSVVSCGSYTGNGSETGPVINLGYEPQWLLIKNRSGATNWMMQDVMRGLPVGGNYGNLTANNTSAEVLDSPRLDISSTGFQIKTTNSTYNTGGSTYIYIAIRRGPMKVPTTGTSVFNAVARTGTNSSYSLTGAGFTPDTYLIKTRNNNSLQPVLIDRIRGLRLLKTSEADPETAASGFLSFDMDGYSANNSSGYFNNAGGSHTFINWMFKRAPGFFDTVTYNGESNSAGQSVSHGLGVTPEFIMVKRRSTGAEFWSVLITSRSTRLVLTATNAEGSPNQYFGGSSSYVAPTSTIFTAGPNGETGQSTHTYVAHLFATCPGVSKVGSYTGTATTNQVNCGFTAGARFVLIKRVDSTGAWYVWDTVRGIISGNDPYLLLNSSAIEVTDTDYIDPYSAGFELSSSAPAAINASGGTYIFLAIA